MLNKLQSRILRRISPGLPDTCNGRAYEGKSKLAVLMGNDFFSRIAGKLVVDFGCGEGADAIEMARHGAGRVIGIDIREEVLTSARRAAADAGVESVCSFAGSMNGRADVVVSLDAFEHFSDPAEVLRIMSRLLKPEGEVLVCFG